MSQQVFTLPDGRPWALPEFVRSPEEAAERDRLLSGRYFLVRQGSLGEIFRCRRCNVRHQYLSLFCCERPFSGIAEGLWGYLSVAGTPQAYLRMTPEERDRIDRVQRMFGPAPLKDFGSSHPEMARALGVAERDIFRGGVPLGVLEEVPAALAQRFQDRINLRGCRPKLALPGLQEN